MNDPISTERLDLISMTPAFLRSTIASQRADAEAMLGASIPAAWWACGDFAALRLRDHETGLTWPPWLPRAIRLRATGEMVGHIGFHTPPAAPYLHEFSPAGVEFGYTIYPAYRRKGYAREASAALIQWAHTEHGVTSFIVSVSPANAASLGLIAQLGFRRIGSHLDEVDGPEDIFELKRPVAPGDAPAG